MEFLVELILTILFVPLEIWAENAASRKGSKSYRKLIIGVVIGLFALALLIIFAVSFDAIWGQKD